MKLYINYDVRNEVTRDDLGKDGPYTGFRESTTYLNVNYLSRSSKEMFPEDKEVSDEVFNSDKAYLVVVRYSTGSTFGHENGCYDFIAIFKDPNEADALAKELRNAGEDNTHPRKYECVPTIKNPAYTKIYMSWIGYFNHLEDIEVLPLAVER